MGALTNDLEAAVFNTMRGANITAHTGYLALFTAAPGEAGGGTEVTGGSYARQAVTFGAPDASAGMANSADIVFPIATAAWGTVTHCALFDAVTSGAMKWYGALTASKVIDIGDQVKFPTGNFVLTLD